MTVSTTTRRNQYGTNGTTGPFPVTFPFLGSSHLAVTHTDSAGVEVSLTLNVDYTLAADEVTTTIAYPPGGYITIVRSIPALQELDLRDGDSFPAESLERSLDLLTMLIQGALGDLDRTLRVPEVTAVYPNLPDAASRALRLLGFDSIGDPIATLPTAGDATSLALDLISNNSAKGDALLWSQRTNLTNVVGHTTHRWANGRAVSLYEFMSAAQIADVEAGTLLVDCSAAVQNFLDAISTGGGLGIIPFGKYQINSQVTLTRSSGTTNLLVYAYGAEFYTSGAISGLRISGSFTPMQTSVEGLKINHRGNATATYGFELVGTNNARIRSCTVEAHGVAAGYAACILRNTTAADANTGCFWTVIEDFTVRKRNGADPGDIPIGIRLQGAANATEIRGGNIGGTVTDGVYITPESGQTYIANGVLIDGVAFEGGTRAIRVVGAAAAAITGLRVWFCRAEAYTTFVSLEGSTAQPVTPPHLGGNFLDPSVAYISNANSLYIFSLDNSTNPNLAPVLDTGTTMQVRNRSGAGAGFDVWAPTTTAPAYIMRNSAGTEIMRMRQGTNTTDARIQAQAGANQLELVSVKGITRGVTPALNLAGTVTLAAGTATVTFANTEPDANYVVAIAGNQNETFRVAAGTKSTTGFTITSSNAGSTAIVDWHVIR